MARRFNNRRPGCLRLIMKAPILLAVSLLLSVLPGHAGEAALAADVSQVKQSVLELNRELYQLEQDLLSPATTRLALYLSLQGGEYFEPLALEIRRYSARRVVAEIGRAHV